MEFQESEKLRIVSGSLLDLSNSSNQVPLGTSGHSEKTQYHDLPAPIYALENSPLSNETPDVANGTSSSGSAFSHQPGHATQSGRVELDPSIFKCSEKTMDGITLTSETIANLYKEFVFNYHPFLPVIDVTRGPEKIYSLCPTLFWTIMAVASRRYDKDGELIMRLAEILKTCLSEITISPVNRFEPGDTGTPVLNVASAYTVQAFLIYTMWPSLTSSLSADSSWNTAGIAMYSAIRVGLHCPGYARDFGRIKVDNPIYPKISEQLRTWICCNIVSQTVATVYGFPAFTSFDASVLSACDGSAGIDIPDPIKQLMAIQHLEEEVANTLNSNPKDPLGLSELSERLALIRILSRKLDELEMRLGTLDDCRKFVLLGARVHLLTYYYLDNGGYSELQLQKGMIQAYNSALALMEHCNRAYKRDKSFFRYMPGIYTQILWQSSAIICKVFHSPFVQFVDGNAGRQMYMACVKLISKASILKHDMMYRAAEIMQQVWRLFGALARRNASSPRIVIRTRMAASVFFDCLWTMREEIGIKSVAPVVLDQRNPEDADNDDDGDDEGFNSTNGSPAATPAMHTNIQLVKKSKNSQKRAESISSDVNTYSQLPSVSSKHQSVHEAQSSSELEQLPGSPNRNGASSLFAEQGDFLNRQLKPMDSTSFLNLPDLGTAPRMSNQSAGFSLLSQQQQEQAVMNGTDFFSWEADLIWRDVDALMFDFGFREDEAPSTNGTIPVNHSNNNSRLY